MRRILLMFAIMLTMVQGVRAQDVTISTFADLIAFMVAVHTNNYEGQTVKLTNNIDCQGGQFTTGASGTSAGSCFKGTFDGQGYKIYNFVNSGASAGTGQDAPYGVAMFDIARDGAVIKNLTLEGTVDDGAASPDYAAAFVAYAIGKADGSLGLTLDNCHFVGTVTNNRSAAAFVGNALHGSGAQVLKMKDCTVTNSTITSESTYTSGGLVAVGDAVEATGCSFAGTINGKWSLGGLIGKAVGCSFTDCSFNGSMGEGPGDSNATNCGCGGLVGYSDGSTFTGCTATVNIDWDLNSTYNSGLGRTSSKNFVGEGGAAGVTLGASRFVNCSATGTLTAAHGYAGGFVGWTAGAETFNHCTTEVTINAAARHADVVGNGGFAACVASSGARFEDCTTSSQGNDIYGGFYNVQHPKSGVTVGANTFLRCTVNNVSIDAERSSTGGFCVSAWNGTFNNCTVRGGTPRAGFVFFAGKRPSESDDYSYEQISTFTDCAVIGAMVADGFVSAANYDNKADNINIFRRCRAACLFNFPNPYGGDTGFGNILNRGTLVEDCAAYGAELGKYDIYGFAGNISGVGGSAFSDKGAVVRRCVAAVLPLASTKYMSGFAKTISYDTTVEDCYSVYAARCACAESNSNGTQGGFVRRATVGYNDIGNPIARCFALGVVPAGSDAGESAGSFCGVAPYGTSNFVDCYRPEESQVRDVGNIGDDAGVGTLTAAQFSNATAATLPNYDFIDTWNAPMGAASSPYLAASTDKDGNFWVFTAVTSGKGHILINGEEPEEAYPPGSVLTVTAVSDDPDNHFTGWVGKGFANPTAQTTTYTVKNVCVIAATFGTLLYDNADNTSSIATAAADGKPRNVALVGRTLYKDGDWNTLCLPFSLTAEQIAASPLAGADIRALSDASFENNELTLNFTAENDVTAITAGTPYIIKWTKAEDYWDDNDHNIYQPVFEDVTISKTMSDKVCDLGGEKSITFKGSYSYQAFTDVDKSILFLGADNTLYYPDNGATIGAQRAFFELTGMTAGDVAESRILFGEEDDTTEVESVESLEFRVESEGWWTISGVKLEGKPTEKGVYIYKGKKYVIR